MQFLKLWAFAFNSYLERRNILANNAERCQIVQCNQLLEYMQSHKRDYLALVVKRLQNRQLSAPQKLKLLMVIHFALVHTDRHFEKISGISVSANNRIDTQTLQRISLGSKLEQLVGLYSLFLKKLCSISETYKEVQCSLKLEALDFSHNPEKCIQDAFVLINFVKSTAMINRILMFMGRYAKDTFPVIIDFIILVSYDLSRIYNHLLKLRKWMINNFNNFQKQKQKLVVSIIDQVYSVRELVQYFIYNRYYYQFIEVEPFKEVTVGRDCYSMMRKQAYSTEANEEIDLKSFQETYFTMATQNEEKRSRVRLDAKSTIF